MFKNIKKDVLLKGPFLFVLILLFSLAFRITNLDLIEFKTDEAVNLLLASRPLFGHPFAPGGTISSIGILNPPLFTYLLFPLTAVSLDPRWISFFIGFINSLAIAFLFLIIRKYYNQTIALIASIFMAFSPWAIIYSRKIWTQDLLIPFFVPFYYSFHKLLVEKKQIFWIPYTVLALFLIQLHQIVIIFVGILTFFLLLEKVRINFKYILIGGIIGVIPLIPYAFFEINNNCPDCKAFILAKNRLSSQRSLELFMRPLQITNQGNFRFILGDDTLTFSQKFSFVDMLRRIFYIEYLLMPLGLFLFYKNYKKYKSIAYSAALLPIAYFLLKIEPFMHYYIIIVPILFIFLGVSFNYLFSNKNWFLKTASLIVLLLILFESVAFDFSFFSLLKDQGSTKGDYGSTYQNARKETENRLSIFKNYPDYEEIKLTNYIPLDYAYGYMPLGKILYGDVRKKDIPLLDNKLKTDSKDPRVKQKILAFYTKEEPDIKTIDLLREKSFTIKQYDDIYKTILANYLSINLKKEYISENFGFRFFYPQHWHVSETSELLEIKGDYILIKIVKNNLGVNQNNKYYLKNFKNYQITITPLVKSQKKVDGELKAADDVFKTMRP